MHDVFLRAWEDRGWWHANDDVRPADTYLELGDVRNREVWSVTIALELNWHLKIALYQ